MTRPILTIGHSNHPIEFFIDLLKRHSVTALADVRSHPYSRYLPQFCRDALREILHEQGIAYVFLGRELGARSQNPACYVQGKVQYDHLAREPLFIQGIERLVQGVKQYRIALMCAEKDPIDCHRAILVSRHVVKAGLSVSHIHVGGELESHDALETRLLGLLKMPECDMFKSREDYIQDAYLLQGERIAYQDTRMLQPEVNPA
jgi:uncharacterized protein (DUF488 family)